MRLTTWAPRPADAFSTHDRTSNTRVATTYMHSRIALWTPFRDAGPRLHLEVHVDVDLAILLASVFDHAPQGLLIVGLAPAAHVVDGGLTAESATARAVD